MVGFGDRVVLDGLSLDVHRGEILGLVGGSGGGKSVLLRTIIGLLPKRRGSIEVLGVDFDRADEEERRAVERRWGVLFQQGALFSSLTVLQNVQFPMREHLAVSERLLEDVARAKLEMVGIGAGRLRQASLRAVRRHDQARSAGPRAGARPGDRLSRRADLGARPHRGRRLRRPHQDAAAHAGADGVHGDP